MGKLLMCRFGSPTVQCEVTVPVGSKDREVTVNCARPVLVRRNSTLPTGYKVSTRVHNALHNCVTWRQTTRRTRQAENKILIGFEDVEIKGYLQDLAVHAI